ncbi:hypothetical protein C8R44DRAFT_795021 [Mycena epipterygia]|nr:hypothetical protein C8R44DRAFT_795021 [Mycena epipterygia]
MPHAGYICTRPVFLLDKSHHILVELHHLFPPCFSNAIQPPAVRRFNMWARTPPLSAHSTSVVIAHPTDFHQVRHPGPSSPSSLSTLETMLLAFLKPCQNPV